MTAETNRSWLAYLLADEKARNERLLLECGHRGFTLIESSDHEELTIVTARDAYGRVWTSVSLADGFDRIIDPDGYHTARSQQPTLSLPGAPGAFIDWLIRGEN